MHTLILFILPIFIVSCLTFSEKLAPEKSSKISKHGIELIIQDGHTDEVSGLLLNKDRTKLFSYSKDKVIKIWDTVDLKLLGNLEGHTQEIEEIKLSSDETKLFSYSNSQIFVHDTKTYKIVSKFLKYDVRNEKRFVIVTSNSPDSVWDKHSEKLILELQNDKGNSGEISDLRLNEKSGKLITWRSNGTIEIWNLLTGTLERVLNGGSYRIRGCAMNETLLVSSYSDGTIEIWNLLTGTLERVLRGGSYGMWGCAMNETLLASSYSDETVKIWNLNNSELLYSLNKNVKGISFTDDGNKLIFSNEAGIEVLDLKKRTILNSFKKKEIVGSDSSKVYIKSDNEIRIFNVNTGIFENPLKEIHSSKDKLFFESTQTKLIIHSDEKLRIWDQNSGRSLKTFLVSGNIKSVEFDGDEKCFFINSDNTFTVYDYSTGNELLTIPNAKYVKSGKNCSMLFSINGFTIDVWNVSRKEIKKSLTGHKRKLYSAELIDNNTIRLDSSEDWSLQTGKKIGQHKGENEDLTLGYRISGNRVEFLNKKTGVIKKTMVIAGESIHKVLVTKDDRTLISVQNRENNMMSLLMRNGTGTVKVWDTLTGKLIYTIQDEIALSDDISLNESENRLISIPSFTSKDILGLWSAHPVKKRAKIKIWNFKNGKPLHSINNDRFSEEDSKIEGIRFYKNKSRLLSYFENGIIKVWDLKTGKITNVLEGHSSSVNGVLISKDESKLISYSTDNTIKIWDLRSGKNTRTVEHSSSVNGVLISRDESKLISYSNDNTIKIWDLKSGKNTGTLEHSSSVKGVFISKDESKLISYSNDNTIKIWDLKSGKNTGTLEHYSSDIQEIFFKEDSNNPNLLLSVSTDSSLRYWDIESGKLLLSQLLFKNGESIYYTGDGRFDYTDKSVLEFVSFRVSDRFIDMIDIQDQFYTKGLLQKIITGKLRTENIDSFAKALEIVPRIELQYPAEDRLISGTEKETEIGFNLKDMGTGIREIKVLVNGIEVRIPEDVKKRLTEKNDELDLTMNVPTVAGQNRLQITAYNKFGGPNTKYFTLNRDSKGAVFEEPRMYLLGIGINSYEGSRRLKYSVNDAESVLRLLKEKNKKIYKKSNIEVTELYDLNASRENIVKSLNDIAMKSKIQDVVVIYYSGHGSLAPTGDGKGLFYLIPQDFDFSVKNNERAARNYGVDMDIITEAMSRMLSRKVVLMFDACHSGGAKLALNKGSEEQESSLEYMEKVAAGTGRFIFTSSAGDEYSRESEKIKHGIFTYVLLEALKGKNADYIPDGKITLTELNTYIQGNFPAISKRILGNDIQSPPFVLSVGRDSVIARENDFPFVPAE